ncbi:hypothetical protein UFOVP60_49 [uncultured Caudovirales phage]|jgi:hypothetical protein|uniref:Uncharacterized protein n=1 Tax=uncultured Caudovirales phage TaxID=2100421 RepID=A0A6J5T947_9CAUD|nr:hypothetical protein UFOVP60_49 [uncultured Caudovirales phage]
MGWVRKITGADAQARNLTENAARQVEATKAAAADQTKQLMESARMAAEQQRILAEREAAGELLAKTSSLDTSTVDVSQAPPGAGSLAETQKRRAQFKFGAQGVSL